LHLMRDRVPLGILCLAAGAVVLTLAIPITFSGIGGLTEHGIQGCCARGYTNPYSLVQGGFTLYVAGIAIFEPSFFIGGALLVLGVILIRRSLLLLGIRVNKGISYRAEVHR
jgi:hypothetical protein